MISERVYFLTHTVCALITKGWNGEAAVNVAERMCEAVGLNSSSLPPTELGMEFREILPHDEDVLPNR
jgi:hypothetical protein